MLLDYVSVHSESNSLRECEVYLDVFMI